VIHCASQNLFNENETHEKDEIRSESIIGGLNGLQRKTVSMAWGTQGEKKVASMLAKRWAFGQEKGIVVQYVGIFYLRMWILRGG